MAATKPKAPAFRVKITRDGVEIQGVSTCAGCGRTLGLKGSDLQADRVSDAWMRQHAGAALLGAGWRADPDGDRCPSCPTPGGKKCAGRLAWHQIAGMLVTEEDDAGRKVYRFRCPACGRSGTAKKVRTYCGGGLRRAPKAKGG